jgi:hypothetical protein
VAVSRSAWRVCVPLIPHQVSYLGFKLFLSLTHVYKMDFSLHDRDFVSSFQRSNNPDSLNGSCSMHPKMKQGHFKSCFHPSISFSSGKLGKICARRRRKRNNFSIQMNSAYLSQRRRTISTFKPRNTMSRIWLMRSTLH